MAVKKEPQFLVDYFYQLDDDLGSAGLARMKLKYQSVKDNRTLHWRYDPRRPLSSNAWLRWPALLHVGPI